MPLVPIAIISSFGLNIGVFISLNSLRSYNPHHHGAITGASPAPVVITSSGRTLNRGRSAIRQRRFAPPAQSLPARLAFCCRPNSGPLALRYGAECVGEVPLLYRCGRAYSLEVTFNRTNHGIPVSFIQHWQVIAFCRCGTERPRIVEG